MIDIISNDINTVYNKLNFSTPQIHIISSVDGYDFFEANPAYLWSIIRRPIRYTKTIKQCIDYDSILIDCSPLGSCSNFVKYNFKEVHCVVSMLDSHICKKLRISSLPALKVFFRNAYSTVFSRISCEVVQQIVQLNTLKVNLFVGKPTESFFVLGQFIGKFIVDRIGKTYLLLLEYIGINVRRNTYVTVTEVFGDHFQVYSAVQQKRGVAMSQLM